MPYLPIAPALTNPLLLDTFTVTARTEVVGNDGRATITNGAPVPARGVVTPASTNDLQRLSDYDLQRKTILIISTYSFSGATSTGNKPSWVTWNGDTYEVLSVEAYQRYGLGFTQVLAGIVTLPTVP